VTDPLQLLPAGHDAQTLPSRSNPLLQSFMVQRLVTVLLVFQDAGSQSCTLVELSQGVQAFTPAALVVVPFVQAVQPS
jgi:hypothetical protein